MRFVRVLKTCELEKYIESAWSNDADLINFYDNELRLKDFQNMVYNTCSKIEEYESNSSFCWKYGIEINGVPIGFVVLNVHTRLLYSFGINKQYRVAHVLLDLWDFIYRMLKADFFCLLFKHNTRAINWLKKCGMKEENSLDVNEQMVYLKMN